MNILHVRGHIWNRVGQKEKITFKYGSWISAVSRATSIVLKIAEGSGCRSPREFSRFLNCTLRSNHEVMVCLDIALKLKYTKRETANALESKLEEISSMIIGLSRSLKKKGRG